MATSKRITEAELKRALEGEYAKLVHEMGAAVNNAPDGAIIPASEEPFRDAVARFRRAAFEKAVQWKADAATSAFSSSGRCGGAAAPEQGGADA